MARLIKQTSNNYTNVSNRLIRDDRLTWKARGIFVYLWSQADNWKFYVGEIAKHSKDGKDALTTGLKELEELGYLKRVPKSKSGKMAGYDWILSDLSVTGNYGSRKNGLPVNPPLRINNNKELLTNKELTTNKNDISTSKNYSKPKSVKHKYGEYKNVLLSDQQLEKLKKEFPNWQDWIQRVDGYCQSSGKKYKDYLATIRNWDRKDKQKQKEAEQNDPWSEHYE